ncbi:MAG: DUF2080 family transposase-associated protein [archaeon]|nr:DUF2080 family transposase-associated protein [archaeon]
MVESKIIAEIDTNASGKLLIVTKSGGGARIPFPKRYLGNHVKVIVYKKQNGEET